MWDGSFCFEVVTDATYTVDGMEDGNQDKRLKGKNADLWKLISDELQTKECPLTISKVKSHIDGVEENRRQTPFW